MEDFWTALIPVLLLTDFQTGYEYNITVHGVNCGSQEGTESEPLTITPQGTCMWHIGCIKLMNLNFVARITGQQDASLQLLSV